jgi:cytoskeletal protein RodZ
MRKNAPEDQGTSDSSLNMTETLKKVHRKKLISIGFKVLIVGLILDGILGLLYVLIVDNIVKIIYH